MLSDSMTTHADMFRFPRDGGRREPHRGAIVGGHADGKLYFTDQRGVTLVVAATPKYEVLAINDLGEDTNSSIAISQGDILIRTWKHLWCIGQAIEDPDK